MFLHKFNFLYCYFLSFFFSLTSSNPSLIPRSDFVREIIAETGDTKGVWKTERFCPSETYVYGFNQKMECNSYGVNVMRLVCGMPSLFILSYEDSHGSWQLATSETSTYCSSGDFMNSYKVKKDGYNNGNRLSITDVDIQCSSEQTYRNPGGGCSSGTWTSPASCNGGEAICGYQIRFAESTFFEDNVGMSNTRFYCCLICKKTDGWFLDTGPKCSLCHSYCKTCTSSSENQCTSCFSYDTFSGNNCVQASNYHEAIIATDGAAIAALGVAVSRSDCIGMSWLGGYGILGSGNFFEITVSGKPQHYKLRLKFRFLKIDSWNGQDGQIYVDDILQNIDELKGLSSSSGSLNFGNQCGGLDPENVINVDYEMTHQKMPFKIKFTTNLDGTSSSKSWGIRNLIIGLYKCDVSCLTCSGSANTECLTCYPNAEKINGLCECKSTFYTEKVALCTTDTCTICHACFLGCEICTSSVFSACSKCISNYFLYIDSSNVKQCRAACPSTPSYWGDPDTNTCVATCPATNQFGDVNDHRKCNYCDSSCATCVDLSSKCLSCSGNYYLVIETNKCYASCPTNQYKHDVDKTCHAICPKTFYANTKTGKCTETCPDGTYPNSFSKICEMCESTCFTCTGPLNTDCVSCYPHASLSNGKCQCNLTYFSVLLVCTLPQTCLSCDPCFAGCKVCGSANATDCSSCIENYFLSNSNSCVPKCIDPFLGDILKACVQSCLLTEFTNYNSDNCEKCSRMCLTCPTNAFKNLNNTCEICDTSCLQCEKTATNCISCAANYFKNVLTNLCVSTCPDGYYGDSSNRKCELCDLDCSTCSKEKQNCTSCASSYTLNINKCFIPTFYSQIDTQLTNISSFSSHNFTIYSSFPINNSSKCTYDCENYKILGGINCLIQGYSILKTYSNLAPHYSIQIKFYLITIDFEDLNNFFVNIDNKDLHSILLSNKDNPGNFLCAQAEKAEARRAFNYILPHSSKSIKIKLYTDLNSSSSGASWGISDFSFALLICHDTCLTCSGELVNNCLTCQSHLFLMDNQCIAGCPEPFVGRLSTNKCETAHCRLCSYKVLNKDFQNLCLENCGNGYYQDSNNCIQCSENCNKCDSKDCFECIPLFYLNLQNGKCFSSCQKDINLNQLYFNNITQTCDKDCPPSTFPNNSTKTCWPCDSKCTKCFGLSIDECNNCVDKYFIQNSSCVDSCSAGYFFNEQGKTCEKCIILKCIKCPNANSCLECQSGLLVMKPNNDSCTACDKLNYYKEMGYCSECSANCILCESADRCQTCLSGYYLSTGKCLAQKLIKAQLVYDSINPFRIHLKFDSYWKNGFDMLLSKIQIKINYLNVNLYSYVLKKNEKDNTDFFMDFSFKCNITLGTKLNLKVVGQLPTQDEYNITIREYELPLNEFYQCPDGNIYNVTTKSCYKAIMVTPVLEYSDNLDELIFRFNPDFDSLFQVIPNNTFVSILGINFTYNFIATKQKSYVIKFIFNNSFTNKPVCTLYITIPPQILYNSSNLFTLESNIVSIAMRNYYVMDNTLKNTIENTKITTGQMSSVSSTATMGNSFLSFGSSMAISIMMSMEIIRFLKYLNIDYPPNVEGMFKSSQRGEGLIPDILIDDNEEKATLPYKFTKYKNSIYSFNNNGNILIENLFYLGLGALILFIHKIFEPKITSSSIASKIFDFLLYMLVWNFPITYFLGVYLNYIFFSLLSFKFPCSAATLAGKLNFFYSAILFAIIFMTILLFWWKIRFFHLSRKKEDNSIFPEQYTIPISKSEILSRKNNSFNKNNANTPHTQANFKVINLEESPNEKISLNISENSQPKKKYINKNFLIEDIILPPPKEIKSRESIFSRFLRGKSTAIQKLRDTLGASTKVMNQIIDNFFRRKNSNIKNPNKDSSSTNALFLQKKKNRFDCLNNGLNHANKGQSFYILFDVMRQTFIAFIIVFLFDNSIAATGMINFINFNFFVLIVFIQPQKEKLDLIQAIFNELCVNLACFAAMALAIMEKKGNDGDSNIKFNVGWIIVAANIGFMVVFLGRFFLTFFLSLANYITKIYKKFAENRKYSKRKGIPNKNSISPLSNEDLVVPYVEEGIDGHLKEGEVKKE